MCRLGVGCVCVGCCVLGVGFVCVVCVCVVCDVCVYMCARVHACVYREKERRVGEREAEKEGWMDGGVREF